MRGKSKYKKRIIKPDYKYNSALVAKFIDYLLQDGKKEIATAIVYEAFDKMANDLKKGALEIFEQAVENASPLVEVKPRRIGGATYQVPIEVRASRRVTIAMKALVNGARSKQGKPIAFFLAKEITDAYNKTGDAVAKKDELHKVAEANKAFAHFAKF